MKRRTFIQTTTAAFFSALAAKPLSAHALEGLALDVSEWRPGYNLKDGPAPTAEISAAVDIIVPADPEVPNDFKGTDYNADWVVAAVLGELGMMAVGLYLNKYARQVAGSKFLDCSDADRLAAINAWVTDREDMNSMIKEMLGGLITMSMIGTYEENSPEEELVLFESMGWYDPKDPAGTFRIPCEGYVDCYQFPVRLKKGLKDDG